MLSRRSGGGQNARSSTAVMAFAVATASAPGAGTGDAQTLDLSVLLSDLQNLRARTSPRLYTPSVTPFLVWLPTTRTPLV